MNLDILYVCLLKNENEEAADMITEIFSYEWIKLGFSA
jgi:hypothetical protein